MRFSGKADNRYLIHILCYLTGDYNNPHRPFCSYPILRDFLPVTIMAMMNI